MKSSILALVACAPSWLVACEKSQTKAPPFAAAVPLSGEETDLLKHLPAGNQAIFGGNLFKMQNWLAESPLGKMTAQMSGPKMARYNACIANDMKQMAGAASFVDGGMTARFFMKGQTIEAFSTCAADAQFSSELSSDGKFVMITVENSGVKSPTAYLSVDGGVYGSVSGTSLGGKPGMVTTTRAQLESDIAKLANASAANDSKLIAMLAKVDRTRNFWVVGDATGTPAESKIKQVFGSIQVEGDLAIDVTMQLVNASDGEMMVSKIGEIKSHINDIPESMSAVRDVVRALTVNDTSDGLRMTLKVNSQQLEQVMKQVGPLMAGMMPR
jgi:hypothetical protein